MERLLRILVPVVCVVACGICLAVAALRVAHPFELEWQEGGMLAHVARVRAGEPLYAPPSLEFATFPYPPLYVWTVAAFGEGFLALRLVTVAATVATLLLLAVLARRASESWLGGLAAAGVYAGACGWAGWWLDVGRVDSLAMALATGALVLAHGSGRGGAVAAGVLAALAVLAKQTTLAITLPLALSLVLVGRRRDALLFAGVLVVGTAVAFGGLHLASEGWSSFYLFEMLADHPWHRPKVVGFWTEDMVWLLPTGMALVLAPALGRRWAFFRPPLLGALVAAWVGRAHVGGFDNVLLPAALAAAVTCGIAVGRSVRAGGPRAGRVLAAVLLQVAGLYRDPAPTVPTASDREAGEEIVRLLEGSAGGVFAPYTGYLAERAGRGASVHAMALFDLSAAGGEVSDAVFEELRRALAEGRWEMVVLAEREPFAALLAQRYGPGEALLAEQPEAFFTRSGQPRRPALLYRRRD